MQSPLKMTSDDEEFAPKGLGCDGPVDDAAGLDGACSNRFCSGGGSCLSPAALEFEALHAAL